MIKTVFVAFDGSTHAKKALSVASEVAAKFGARMVIGHALLRDATLPDLRKLANRRALPKAQRDRLDNYEAEILTTDVSGMTGVTPIIAPTDLLAAVGNQLLDGATAVAKKSGLKKVSAALLTGNPADAILARAKKEKADLIVLGTRGLGRLKGLFLGSISHKVSTHAHCPCMTVR